MANVIDPTKVSCSIEFDDEWELDQDKYGDNYNYERVFIITYKVASGLTEKNFYYSIKDTEYYCSPKFISNDTYRYSFTLRESDIAANRSKGTLKVSARVLAAPSDRSIIYEATAEKSELMQLPPKSDIQNLKIEQYTSTPGKFRCSWTAPSLYENRSDDEAVNGYCIRLEHNNRRVRGLKLVSGKLVKDSNYKELAYTDVSGKSKDELKSFIENKNNNITFAGPNCSSTDTEADEVYLDVASSDDEVSFDFVPKELGIMSGDEYIFTIYPYNNIGGYFVPAGDGTNNYVEHPAGTRLTNSGIACGTKTSKGVVRVKHNNNWVEGQVWVMHNNVWKQAQAVYVRKDGKWQEAK